jgi:hypothetical protein
MSTKTDHLIQAAAASATAPATTVPPATVAAMSFMGYSPSDWLVALSILWILVQFVALIVDRVLRFRKACKEKQ